MYSLMVKFLSMCHMVIGSHLFEAIPCYIMTMEMFALNVFILVYCMGYLLIQPLLIIRSSSQPADSSINCLNGLTNRSSRRPSGELEQSVVFSTSITSCRLTLPVDSLCELSQVYFSIVGSQPNNQPLPLEGHIPNTFNTSRLYQTHIFDVKNSACSFHFPSLQDHGLKICWMRSTFGQGLGGMTHLNRIPMLIQSQQDSVRSAHL